MRLICSALVLTVATLVLGCAGENGPTRSRLVGEVKYNDQPVPFGDILFTPDGAKGNSGPQGKAQIRDGKFDTNGPEGKGVGGGAMIVRVTGFSGAGGKLLCEVEVPATLPTEGGTMNFNIPKTKAVPKQVKGPDI